MGVQSHVEGLHPWRRATHDHANPPEYKTHTHEEFYLWPR